jgi:peroxiredoxin Q/BCP
MRLLQSALLAAALAALFGLALPALAGDDKPGKPEVGKPAPAFDLPATQIDKVLPDSKKNTLSLKDLKGKNVVLFFYPKALTRGCTIESCGFRDKVSDFSKQDTVIVGISTDTLDLQKKFTDKENLNFPLLADPNKKVTNAYGALSTRGFANRYTFVIDKDGVLRKVYHKVTPGNHPQEVLDYVKENLSKSK